MAFRRQTRRALRFRDLMPYRVAEILLVSAPYDAFILQQDGRLTEQLFLEFSALSLAVSPRFTHAATGEAALELLAARRFDLVIAMTGLAEVDVEAFGRRVKALYPGMPVVLLGLDRRQLHDLAGRLDREAVDGAFLWNGDTAVLLAIVKSVEDRKNVDPDIEQGGVRVILVVENSPADYSPFLSILYLELMQQAQALYTEGVNEIMRQVYMNSRPKILHATTYEEAEALLERYRANLMALLSDVAFPHHGEMSDTAGLDLVELCRRHDPTLPVLLQSADGDASRASADLGAVFIDKTSPGLKTGVREFLKDSLGFGDFVFRDPGGREIDRARDLRELEEKLATVPLESIYHHAARNHFSIWLQARSEFRLAEIIRPQKVSDFTSVTAARNYLIEALRKTHKNNLRRVVSDFDRRGAGLDPFSRLGDGSLGGKARGLAFLYTRLAEFEPAAPGGLTVALPKTVVVTTDYFEHFLKANHLRDFAYSCEDDDEIRTRFLAAELPDSLLADLEIVTRQLEGPLAVRSSSLLEDSIHLPLAGIYATLMLPNDTPDPKSRLAELARALKLVYASTFLTGARAYLRASGTKIDEEQMAVMIQRLVGRRHGRRYYPCFSGVAQSHNFYPISPQKAEDGIVHLALGLGRQVVDGGQALMFSPEHPRVLPQFTQSASPLDHLQRGFYALDMERQSRGDGRDLASDVRYFDLAAAEMDGTLALVGSVFSADDQRIRDDLSLPGPRIVTFNNILKHRALPLAAAIREWLRIGKEGLGCPVEIEFACDTGDCGQRQVHDQERDLPTFYPLQIRPFAARGRALDPVRLYFRRCDRLCSTTHSLGNGVETSICDLVYAGRGVWNGTRNKAIAGEIGELNRQLAAEQRPYLLIGHGRWGTADEWLGIPVKWSQISQVKALVEVAPEDYEVEVSQGAHFFHNLTSLRIGYLSLPAGADKSGREAANTIDWSWLDERPAHHTTEHLRWLRFEEPLTVALDGRCGHGVIAKPGATPALAGAERGGSAELRGEAT